jgi:hypothetical protein
VYDIDDEEMYSALEIIQTIELTRREFPRSLFRYSNIKFHLTCYVLDTTQVAYTISESNQTPEDAIRGTLTSLATTGNLKQATTDQSGNTFYFISASIYSTLCLQLGSVTSVSSYNALQLSMS